MEPFNKERLDALIFESRCELRDAVYEDAKLFWTDVLQALQMLREMLFTPRDTRTTVPAALRSRASMKGAKKRNRR
jgi:hypothetical protein